METVTGKLILKKGRDKPVRNRHPWVFSGAIQRVEGEPAPGALVEVVAGNGRFLATAYFNPHSQIRARLLSWQEGEAIDADFWRRRITRAVAGRNTLEADPKTNAYRLIHAESDGLPGLVVDKYDDYLVMQCLTLGIDKHKQMLAELLAEVVQPSGIIERSDVNVRKLEGLPKQTGLLWGEKAPDELIVLENGHQFVVDLWRGHKTGFYLDQRDGRTAVSQPQFSNGKDVLNVFAYTGGFAIYAAASNAAKIVNIDSSIPALELAERNIALNGHERPQDEYIAGDAFEVLRHYRDEDRKFDTIILDPPKFSNSQRDVDRACRGYKDLNLLAFQLVKPGGTVATFSCSGRVSAELFQKVIFGAAVDAKRDVQIIQRLGQTTDHPVLLSFPESAYLKGFLCRVW